jgi:mercuric ion binding protein
MKLLILLLLIFNFVFSESHDHKNHHKKHDHKDQVASIKSKKKNKITIFVRGMVCAFCAQGIEKNFNKEPGVKSTKVNLDKMEVKITLKKGETLSEERIKKIVTGAGFSFAGYKE